MRRTCYCLLLGALLAAGCARQGFRSAERGPTDSSSPADRARPLDQPRLEDAARDGSLAREGARDGEPAREAAALDLRRDTPVDLAPSRDKAKADSSPAPDSKPTPDSKLKADSKPPDSKPPDSKPAPDSKPDAGGTVAVPAWAKQQGTADTDQNWAVAVDGAGNVYLAGTYSGSVDLGGGPLPTAQKRDMFLASYTSAGAHRWSKSFGSAEDDFAFALATDASSNVTLAGACAGPVSFGGGTLPFASGDDICLASFSSGGAHRWSKSFGGPGMDRGQALAIDAAANVTLAGFFASSVNFGGGTLSSSGGFDIFLASFDASGAHRWSKRFGGSGEDQGLGVAVDASANVTLTGYYLGAVSLGGAALPNLGQQDAFLASFTSGGAHRWSLGLGGSAWDEGDALAVDAGGNVYLAGMQSSAASFGGAVLPWKGGSDIVLASFSSAGVHRWSKSLGGAGTDVAAAIAVEASGTVYLTGEHSGPVDLGGGALPSFGAYDIFLASFTTAGAHRWSRGFGSTFYDFGAALAVDGASSVYLAGFFSNTMNPGTGSLTSAGDFDGYLVKYTQ